MPDVITLEVRNRGGDCHVQVKEKRGVWGSGKNLLEAIGDLVWHHPKVFGIEVEDHRIKKG